MKEYFVKIREWLASLSFRTGIWLLGGCVLCYVISFGQMLLPLGLGWKGALWTVFFGLAKALQYSAILVLGKEGLRKVKEKFFRKNQTA